MSGKFKLYSFPISPFGCLIHAGLIYKKVDFEYHYVDLRGGKQKEPEYLAMHPFGQVPVLLTDSGQSIYESWSIFEFLEEQFPDLNMLPKNQPDRAKVRSLCFVFMTGIMQHVRDLFLETLGRHKLSDETRTAARENLVAKFEVFASELATLENLPELTPLDAFFHQAWQNASIGYPQIKELVPSLEVYSQSIAKKPAIIAVEATPEVKLIKQAFLSQLATAK